MAQTLKKQPKPTNARPEMDDKPPILGSWKRLYTLEIGVLVLVMAGLWLVTRMYGG